MRKFRYNTCPTGAVYNNNNVLVHAYKTWVHCACLWAWSPVFLKANHEITLNFLDWKLVHCITYTCCLGAHLSLLSDQETRLQASSLGDDYHIHCILCVLRGWTASFASTSLMSLHRTSSKPNQFRRFGEACWTSYEENDGTYVLAAWRLGAAPSLVRASRTYTKMKINKPNHPRIF